MDYRSSIPDDENPGASPWGSSPPVSPRRNLERQAPSFRYEQQSSGEGGFGVEDHGEGPFNPSQASSASHATTDTSFNPSAESSQQEQADFSDNTEHHQSQASTQEQNHPSAQHQQNSDGDNASHDQSQQQQPRRSNQPQYKLQAKITGLERTGRKDPILRFDVHVSRDDTSPVVSRQHV